MTGFGARPKKEVFAVLSILFLFFGILLVASLFVDRFLLLRDNHPNTDLLIHTISRCLGPELQGHRKR